MPKPVGRPRKFPPNRTRAGIRFRHEQYEKLKEAAHEAGRSVSEEVEARIERLDAYETALLTMKKIDQMTRDNFEAAARQLGYGVVWTEHGDKIFVPAGTVPRSGFVTREEQPEDDVASAA